MNNVNKHNIYKFFSFVAGACVGVIIVALFYMVMIEVFNVRVVSTVFIILPIISGFAGKSLYESRGKKS
ncbi:MAG TPA: hypothetical protein EYN54_14360 [Methylococcaceae bacterium]|nr:hypothetical protein [Methylococcaceae bacterium]